MILVYTAFALVASIFLGYGLMDVKTNSAGPWLILLLLIVLTGSYLNLCVLPIFPGIIPGLGGLAILVIGFVSGIFIHW